MKQTKKRHLPQPDNRGRYTYFAYGSNLHVPQMRRRCRDAAPVCVAALPEHQLVFRGVADVEAAEGQQVMGALWSISAADLRALDRYEGYPFLYTRYEVEVHTAHGPTTALVYAMNDTDQEYPSELYLRNLKDGYAHFDLPVQALADAIDRVEAWEEARRPKKVWKPTKNYEAKPGGYFHTKTTGQAMEGKVIPAPKGGRQLSAGQYKPTSKKQAHRWKLGPNGVYMLDNEPYISPSMSPATQAEYQLDLTDLAKQQLTERASPEEAQELWEEAASKGYLDSDGVLTADGGQWLSQQVNDTTFSRENWTLVENADEVMAMALEDEELERTGDVDWEDVRVGDLWVRVYDQGLLRVLNTDEAKEA
jgi:Uncharacterized conserved protein